MKIANICGSNGRKAVPLALLGADVTIFDISEENKRYAIELADCADVNIKLIQGSLMELFPIKASSMKKSKVLFLTVL